TVTKAAPKPAPPPSPKPAPPAAPPPAPPAAPPSAPPVDAASAKPLIVVPPNTRAGPEGKARNPAAAAARARRAIDTASALIERGEQDRALFLLWEAIPYLTSHQDSMDAAYHASEALLMKADKENNQQPRNRACQILTRMKTDPSGYLASSVQALFD